MEIPKASSARLTYISVKWLVIELTRCEMINCRAIVLQSAMLPPFGDYRFVQKGNKATSEKT